MRHVFEHIPFHIFFKSEKFLSPCNEIPSCASDKQETKQTTCSFYSNSENRTKTIFHIKKQVVHRIKLKQGI